MDLYRIKEIQELCNKYEWTEGYKFRNDDIIMENDNYICIFQLSEMGNIIFLKSDEKHDGSLAHSIAYFRKRLYKLCCRLNLNMLTVRNKRWKHFLERFSELTLAYENDEYLIYRIEKEKTV